MTAESSHLMSRLRLEDGVSRDDLPFIERTLAQLFAEVERFDSSMLDIGLRIKDRGRPGMRTSLEVHVQGLSSMIGVSKLTDTKDALNDAEAKVLAQLRGHVGRRNHHRPRQPQA
ncbi:MAG: hypothetical protein L0H25_08730 [Micrococcales bacterium]|nr:hypothetical protein [Micrococcales bacterium]